MKDSDSPKGATDPIWVGLADGLKSGWYVPGTGEVVTGFPVTAEDTVLDLGCGNGPSSLFCAKQGADVTFTDLLPEAVAEVEKAIAKVEACDRYRGIVGDSNPLLVDDESMTRIMCCEVLEHVEDPAQVLGELVRVGKPGALYLLTVPGEAGEKMQQAFALPEYFEAPNHIRIFSKDDFISLVEGAGLEIERYEAYGFFMLFWMCMHWLIIDEQIEKGSYTPALSETMIQPPFHQNIHHLADMWKSILDMPKGLEFKKQMDQLLPKSQYVIARKPG